MTRKQGSQADPSTPTAQPKTAKVLPFNPLERKHLGESVAQELLKQSAVPLGKLPKFEGAGVYAIYYKGNFGPYRLLAEANLAQLQLPIYVGKAIPEGGRTGVETGDAKSRLRGRLQEHAASIKTVNNLDIEHFVCRYLVVEDIWIPLGESLLIARFAPLWNTTVTGFGNHTPGKGRKGTTRPRWDVLHPGRKWAAKLDASTFFSADTVAKEAEDYLRSVTIPTSPLAAGTPLLLEPPPVNMSNEETDV